MQGECATSCKRSAAASGNSTLNIAGDCSGWCTEAQAAEAVSQLPVRHLFASDSNPACRKLIAHAFKPEKIYANITERKVPQERVDVYTSGFPCQPFSRAGLQLGWEDARGAVALHVLSFLEVARPSAFILENVPAMATDFPEAFQEFINILAGIGESSYKVDWTLLSAQVHGGPPQSRDRLYIVGLQKSKCLRKFSWPRPLPRVLPLHAVLADAAGTDQDFQSLNNTCRRNVERMMECLLKKKSFGDVILDMGGSTPAW